jgi:hypothetical protein
MDQTGMFNSICIIALVTLVLVDMIYASHNHVGDDMVSNSGINKSHDHCLFNKLTCIVHRDIILTFIECIIRLQCADTLMPDCSFIIIS